MTVGAIASPDPRSIAIGPFGSRMKADNYVDSGIPVVRGNNITKTRSPTGNFVFITEKFADSMPGCILKAGDLVFPHRGAIGEVGLIEGDAKMMLSTSLMKLTPNASLMDPTFVYYYFKSNIGRRELLMRSSTVGTPGIGQPLSSLRSIPIPVPPIEEQRGIAATLGALDDKIESNRRAHAIIWGIFEAEFDLQTLTSPTIELRSLLRLEYGKSLPAPTRLLGAIPVYGSNGITGIHNASLIDGPGVIVGRKGSVGEVHWSHTPSFPIDTTYYATPVDGYPLLASYFALLRAGLTDMNSHSAIPGLNRESALARRVRALSPEVAREWAASRRCFLDEIVHLEAGISALKALRDTLLPELLSGRIRVPEQGRGKVGL